MAKILWYGDAVSHTGFSRVTHSILKHLQKNSNHEIVVFGINYTGDPHDYPFKIYPATAANPHDRFGLQRLPGIVEKEKPDFIICLNDIWIVNQVWEKIHFLQPQLKFKFIPYFPIDSERYVDSMLRFIKDWDFSITFTIEQAQRIQNHDVQPKMLGVLPHGIDEGKFFPKDRDEARKELGIPTDRFIVLNANRNQPRKRIDLTIQAFAEFAKDKPDTMLYLHMSEKDLGWSVRELFDSEMKRRGVDPTNRLIMTSRNINYMEAPSDEILNLIYNSCDVGINTADGEGWGLVPFEHASCKRAQIVPNHTSCRDIWKNKAPLINVATWVRDKDLSVERGIIDVGSAVDHLNTLYEDETYREHVAKECYEVTQNPSYRWDKIALGFEKAMEDLSK
jgi:glycosyltransferase involved in cell wall biosynthesis